jgi:hypothetical protein
MKKRILITGYERSGTTLLRRLVSMHPALGYDIVHERRDLLLKAQTRQWAIKNMTYPVTQNKQETGGMMSIKAGQKLPYVFARDFDLYFAKFKKLFKKFHVIHIIRDPLSAINSQVRTFEKDVNLCIKTYFNNVPKVYKTIKIDKTESIVVKYEDIISDPFNFVNNIYKWIGDFDGDAEYIKRVISTRDPWDFNGRIMCGLRYFDGIKDKKTEIVLSEDKVKSIRKMGKVIK